MKFSLKFLFVLNNTNSPTPAFTATPDINTGIAITFSTNNSVNITDDAQFGINPTNPAIIGPNMIFLKDAKDIFAKCNELFNIEENRALTDNRIKNVVICMQRWFRALPQIARNASSLSMYVDNREIQKCMKAVKKVLQKIEYNPYEMLFVDIPKQFSANNLSETYEKLEQYGEKMLTNAELLAIIIKTGIFRQFEKLC